MRCGLYARVSTAEQTAENQLRELRTYAAARGWTQVTEYVDEGVSGATDRRPALDRLLRAARARQLDAVLVWKLDRLARSTRFLLTVMEEFEHLGLTFVSLREQFDTAGPMGRMIYTVLGAVAELERTLIVERVRAGMARARDHGVHCGRRKLLVSGLDVVRVCREWPTSALRAKALKVSPRTLRRALHEYRDLLQSPA